MSLQAPGDAVPDVDADDVLAETHQHAYRRRFALATRHPDVERVDPSTFWLIWQDGAAWAMRESARLSPHLMKSAELIVLLAQAHEAAPSTCPSCGAVLEEVG